MVLIKGLVSVAVAIGKGIKQGLLGLDSDEVRNKSRQVTKLETEVATGEEATGKFNRKYMGAGQWLDLPMVKKLNKEEIEAKKESLKVAKQALEEAKKVQEGDITTLFGEKFTATPESLAVKKITCSIAVGSDIMTMPYKEPEKYDVKFKRMAKRCPHYNLELPTESLPDLTMLQKP